MEDSVDRLVGCCRLGKWIMTNNGLIIHHSLEVHVKMRARAKKKKFVVVVWSRIN